MRIENDIVAAIMHNQDDKKLAQQAGLSEYLYLLARLSFWGMIIFIPFRYRTILLSRSEPPVWQDFTDFLLFASDVFMLATLLFWGVSFLFDRRKIKTGPFFLTYPLLAVVLISGLSIFFSVDRMLSTYHFVRLLFLGGLYLYIINEVHTLQDVAIPILVQVLLQGWIGISQALAQHSLGWYSWGELELDPTWSGVSVIELSYVRTLRAYGLTDHPNILGGCLALGLLILAGWYLERDADPDRRWQPVRAVLLIPGLVCLLLTFSRSAWLGVAGGLVWVVFCLFRTRQQQTLLTLTAIVGAWIVVAFPFIWQNLPFLGLRINPRTVESGGHEIVVDTALSERRLLGEAANQMFVSHAILGTGLGTFPIALFAVEPTFPIDYQPVHNVLLDVASEIGLFGGVFFFLAMITPWLAMWLNRSRLRFSPALIACSAALLAAMVIGLFDYYLWYLIPGRLWQVLVWGLWAVMYQEALQK